MNFTNVIETVGYALDLVGVGLIAIGLVIAFVRYVTVPVTPGGIDAYRRLRQDIGRAILLGLEVLVAADIIRTVAVTPTLDSVAILGADRGDPHLPLNQHAGRGRRPLSMAEPHRGERGVIPSPASAGRRKEEPYIAVRCRIAADSVPSSR